MSGAGVRPRMPSFAPATTIKEATKFAEKNLAKEVSYRGIDVEIANLINEELYNLSGGGNRKFTEIGGCSRIAKKIGKRNLNNKVLAAVTRRTNAVTEKAAS